MKGAARVLFVEEEDGGRMEHLRRICPIPVEAATMASLKAAVDERPDLPQLVCADWYSEMDQLNELARWLLNWGDNGRYPLQLIGVRPWWSADRISAMVTAELAARNLWGRAPLPDEVIHLIACATHRAQRVFAVACAYHAILSVVGQDTELSVHFLLLREEARDGNWDSLGVIARLKDVTREMVRMLVEGPTLTSSHVQATCTRLARCCNAALHGDSAVAANLAAGYALPVVYRGERLLLALARHELCEYGGARGRA